MVAVEKSIIERIKNAQSEVEPLIVDMIKGSGGQNCPYGVMKKGELESPEMKEAVTKVARMLYQAGLLNKLDISLSNDEAYDTLIYAFGYWGGKTLHKHGNSICKCENRCY